MIRGDGGGFGSFYCDMQTHTTVEWGGFSPPSKSVWTRSARGAVLGQAIKHMAGRDPGSCYCY